MSQGRMVPVERGPGWTSRYSAGAASSLVGITPLARVSQQATETHVE